MNAEGASGRADVVLKKTSVHLANILAFQRVICEKRKLSCRHFERSGPTLTLVLPKREPGAENVPDVDKFYNRLLIINNLRQKSCVFEFFNTLLADCQGLGEWIEI